MKQKREEDVIGVASWIMIVIFLVVITLLGIEIGSANDCGGPRDDLDRMTGPGY